MRRSKESKYKDVPIYYQHKVKELDEALQESRISFF